MNIVVVTPSLLGDAAASGGDVSAAGFLKNFAGRHSLHVIAFDERHDPAASDLAVRDMEKWAASVRVVPLRMTIPLRLKAKLLKIFFVPKGVVRHSSKAFRMACKETMAKYPIDLAVIQFPKMAQYVEEFGATPTVMDVQDAYSISTYRSYETTRGRCFVARGLAARTWLSWLRYERHYYAKFDHLFVVSEQDSYGLRVFNPGLKTTVLPRMMSLKAGSYDSESAPFHIGFIGSFSHKPNILAIKFLFELVLPDLVKRIPDLRVLIAGKEPPKELTQHAPACVTFAGFVPTVDDFYKQVRIVIAPLVAGGGVKIKVIEGLLSGLPVVTTSIGAEGIGLSNGVDALIADEPDEFAKAIFKLATDCGYRTSIGAAGQKHAMGLSSAERHLQLVEEVFESLKTS